MTIRTKTVALCVLLALAVGPALAAAEKPLLAQQPSLSRTQIVFAFAGDLWLTGRGGGPASRLTTGVGIESDPFFSPDGSLVAFSGQYDGNTDVYIVPAAGGIPRRLTHHPDADEVVGWKPDGKHVIFRSARNSFSPVPTLFTVGLDGGFPEELPLPTGVSASFSADGVPPGLRTDHAVAEGLEAVPGRSDNAHLDHRSFRPQGREDPPRELQRFESDVGRGQDLFPFGPQGPGVPFRL